MAVDDWIGEFVLAHMARTGRVDYPRLGSDDARVYWQTWRDAFVRKGVDYAVAMESSSIVATQSLAYCSQQLPAVMAECDRIFRERNQESSGLQSGTRDHALANTPEDCECGRGGVVVRFRHEPVGEGKGHNSVGSVVNLHCVCPMGRWVRSRLSPDLKRGFLDLAAHPHLQLGPVAWSETQDCAFRYRPDHWDVYHRRPVAVASFHPTDSERTRSGGRISHAERLARLRASEASSTPEDAPGGVLEPVVELTPEESERREQKRQDQLRHFQARQHVQAVSNIAEANPVREDPWDQGGLGIDELDPPPPGAYEDDDPFV